MMINRWIGPLAAALTLVATTPARADDGDPAPVLIIEEEQAETPQPVCEICAIVAAEDAEDSASATLTLTHTDTFMGDVELVIWLTSGETTSLWVEGVTITDGLVVLDIESGAGWGWGDVRYSWARFHSAL